jgi:hypothetical protein
VATGVNPFGALVLALALVAGGCSDSGGKPPPDTGPASDSTLFDCKDPGLACNAHNPCAINPVCGKDYKCRPERRLNCDDGLDCTNDGCGQAGQCVNTPKAGFCALLVKDPAGGPSEMKCVAEGTPSSTDPCRVCDPRVDTKKWSPANGGKCNDGNPCTKDDYCQGGECKGTYYGNKCSDGLECTDDVCDGVGGCSNAMKKTYCMIDGKCVKDKQPDPSGCLVCDVAIDPKKWTPLPSMCKIGGLCFLPGAADVTGCGVCDPAKSTSGWSAAPGSCFIAGACYKSGAKDTSGCGECNAANPGAWTPVAGKCLIEGSCVAGGVKSASGCGVCDAAKSPGAWSPVSGAAVQVTGFDGSAGGWSFAAPVSGVGWQLSSKRARAGSGSLYYGGASGSYDSGSANQGSASSPAIALPAGKAALSFWVWLDVETSPAHDQLSLRAGTTTLWSKASLPATAYRRWTQVEVSLTSLAGQSVTLAFVFDTVDGWGNSGEGVYVDELSLITGCP